MLGATTCGQIRAVLTDRTNFKTSPQIIVGCGLFGGRTDDFNAYKEGGLQNL
jgi:glutaredoxin-related protein